MMHARPDESQNLGAQNISERFQPIYNQLLSNQLLSNQLLYSQLLCSQLLYNNLLHRPSLYIQLLYNNVLLLGAEAPECKWLNMFPCRVARGLA